MNTGVEKDRGPRPGDWVQAADRHWRVLFIGDHGKVIAFKRIKTLIGLTIGVITTALTAVVVLVAVNVGLQARARELQKQVEATHLQVQSLRQERDLLTAHVVLVETRMKETLAGGRRKVENEPPNPAGADKAIDASATPPPEPMVATAAAPPETAEEVKLPVGLGDGVAVEGFQVGFDALRQTFSLRYKLVATRTVRKPMAGHVIVVFKGEDIEPERWLAMPRIDLSKGRPSGRQKGYTFSISHSKLFSHSMPAPASFPAFTRAVVYVFSNEGQLLMARDYDIDVKPSAG